MKKQVNDTIIVVGASRGLGRAVAERFLSKGFQIIGISRNIERLPFKGYKCDITDFAGLAEIAKVLRNENLKIVALINTAGIASMNLALTTTASRVRDIVNVNLTGIIYSCKNFSPLLIRGGGGSIINFSTIAVSLALEGESIYAASKAGIENFTKTFAKEVSNFNIRVNCIAPGPIETDLIKNLDSEKISKIIERQILKKQFHKNDVCDLVELLLDPRAKSISGQVINMGGV